MEARIILSRVKLPGIFSADKLIFLFTTSVVVYLVLPPIALLILSSFKSTADRLPVEPGPLTLSNYVQVLSTGDTYLLFQNSLIYAFSCVVGALAIAILMVWLTERTDLPGKNLVFTLLLMPIAMPGMVKAIGWTFLANPTNGLINVVSRELFGISGGRGPFNIYSLSGMIFVGTLSMMPSLFLMIAGAFRNFDPAFEEASEASGVSRSKSQLLITMPLLRPALFGAFIYYLASALDDFQIPAILGLNAGIRVFSTKIFLATHPDDGLPDYGLASGYGMILFVTAMILIVLYRRMMRKKQKYAVVTGKGYRPRLIPLGRWKHVALGSVALYLTLAVVLPVFILFWISLQPYVSIPSVEAMGRVTLSNYSEMLAMSHFKEAVINTIVISLIVATATMFLSTLTAWMAVRGRFPGHSLPDLLTFINTAVPSVVFALAIAFIYLSFPILPIYGTIWILVIAYTTRYMSYCTRLMGGAVIQIHQELEEASQTSGVSRWTTFLRVTLPLLLPSFFNGWLWVAVHALRETTIAIMLFTQTNAVVAALIWEEFQFSGGTGLVAAMSVCFTLASFILTFLGRRALLRQQPY